MFIKHPKNACAYLQGKELICIISECVMSVKLIDTIICKIDHFVISRFKKPTTWIVILSGKNKYEQIYSLDTCTYVVRDRLFLFMLSKMYCSRNDFRFSFLFNSHSYAGWFKIQHNRVNCRVCGEKNH